jgi:hypothetical protein
MHTEKNLRIKIYYLSLSSYGVPFSGNEALMASNMTCGMSDFFVSLTLGTELCKSSQLSPGDRERSQTFLSMLAFITDATNVSF